MATNHFSGSRLVVRGERKYTCHWRTCHVLVIAWCGGGVPSVFPLFKAYPSFLRAIEHLVEAATPFDGRIELFESRRYVHRTIRRGDDKGFEMGASDGFICLYYVLPLSGSLPGIQHRKTFVAGCLGDQQTLQLELWRRHG